jgi:hypothetical protein
MVFVDAVQARSGKLGSCNVQIASKMPLQRKYFVLWCTNVFLVTIPGCWLLSTRLHERKLYKPLAARVRSTEDTDNVQRRVSAIGVSLAYLRACMFVGFGSFEGVHEPYVWRFVDRVARVDLRRMDIGISYQLPWYGLWSNYSLRRDAYVQSDRRHIPSSRRPSIGELKIGGAYM